MPFLQTSILSHSQKVEILALWNRESPQYIVHDSVAELEKYLDKLDNVIYTLTLDEEGKIVGWFADFDRDGGRWFVMLLDASIHRKGIGSALLTKAKERHDILNGWVVDHPNEKKLDGDPYLSPVDFYLNNGFEIVPDVRLEPVYLSCVKMVWSKNK